MSEPKRPENIPGYVHPVSASNFSGKNRQYRTFTERGTSKTVYGRPVTAVAYSSNGTLMSETPELCPVCSETPSKICNCVYSDKQCKNGHFWYYDRDTDKISYKNPHAR